MRMEKRGKRQKKEKGKKEKLCIESENEQKSSERELETS